MVILCPVARNGDLERTVNSIKGSQARDGNEKRSANRKEEGKIHQPSFDSAEWRRQERQDAKKDTHLARLSCSHSSSLFLWLLVLLVLLAGDAGTAPLRGAILTTRLTIASNLA